MSINCKIIYIYIYIVLKTTHGGSKADILERFDSLCEPMFAKHRIKVLATLLYPSRGWDSHF
jgi:hypothetical protein